MDIIVRNVSAKVVRALNVLAAQAGYSGREPYLRKHLAELADVVESRGAGVAANALTEAHNHNAYARTSREEAG
jgi:hypothetical protein